MNQEDIARAIQFMAQLDKIRASLELDVGKASDETKYIYIEFVLPENK